MIGRFILRLGPAAALAMLALSILDEANRLHGSIWFGLKRGATIAGVILIISGLIGALLGAKFYRG